VLNEERRTEMSTIKLTPTPNKPRDPLLRNRSLSSQSPFLRNAVFNNSSSLFERSMIFPNGPYTTCVPHRTATTIRQSKKIVLKLK
jgi:hypothetical protein